MKLKDILNEVQKKVTGVTIQHRGTDRTSVRKVYVDFSDGSNEKLTLKDVKNSKYADKIILCTTDLKQDEILCDIAIKNNIDFYQGDEDNKSKRWYGECKKFDINFFVTADGDDLCYDAGLSDLCFEPIEVD